MLSSNMDAKICVAVRVRPLIEREALAGGGSHWSADKNVIQQVGSDLRFANTLPYVFDHVFDIPSRTSQVYEKIVAPVVRESLNGFNGTILCYGQTSSGKTFTLYGSDTEEGIISLAAQDLFKQISKDHSRTYLIRVGLVEIYNEKVSDLLNSNKPVEIKEINGIVTPKDLEEIEIEKPEDLLAAAKRAQQQRRIGETRMNKESSRSHTIMRIYIESAPRRRDLSNSGHVTNALLNFVDLAGSEKAGQTGAEGDRFKEATLINRFFSVLSLVVNQLSVDSVNTTKKFASFRDSTLTRILQSSLSGNAYIVIICNVTPSSIDETHSTLRFAKTAKKIKTEPKANLVVTDNAKYQQKIRELQSQVDRLEKELEGKSAEAAELKQRLDTFTNVSPLKPKRKHLDDSGPETPRGAAIRMRDLGEELQSVSPEGIKGVETVDSETQTDPSVTCRVQTQTDLSGVSQGSQTPTEKHLTAEKVDSFTMTCASTENESKPDPTNTSFAQTQTDRVGINRGSQTLEETDLKANLRSMTIRAKLREREMENLEATAKLEDISNRNLIKELESKLANNYSEVVALKDKIEVLSSVSEIKRKADSGIQCDYIIEQANRAATTGERGLLPPGFPDLAVMTREVKRLRDNNFILDIENKKCTCRGRTKNPNLLANSLEKARSFNTHGPRNLESLRIPVTSSNSGSLPPFVGRIFRSIENVNTVEASGSSNNKPVTKRPMPSAISEPPLESRSNSVTPILPSTEQNLSASGTSNMRPVNMFATQRNPSSFPSKLKLPSQIPSAPPIVSSQTPPRATRGPLTVDHPVADVEDDDGWFRELELLSRQCKN